MDKKAAVCFLASLGGWFFTGVEPILRSVLLAAQLAAAVFSAAYFYWKLKNRNKKQP